MTTMEARPLLLTFPLFLSACAACFTQPAMQSIGHSERQLIADWGPPARVVERGDGRKVLTYTAVGGVCRTSFGLDPGGTVRSFDHQGW